MARRSAPPVRGGHVPEGGLRQWREKLHEPMVGLDLCESYGNSSAHVLLHDHVTQS